MMCLTIQPVIRKCGQYFSPFFTIKIDMMRKKTGIPVAKENGIAFRHVNLHKVSELGSDLLRR